MNNIRTYCCEFRDPIICEKKFYWQAAKSSYQFIVIWENGKVYANYKDGSRVELLYAHFFRRKFSVYDVRDSIKIIKVIPQKVVFNEGVKESDFYASEKKFYKIMYYYAMINNSIGRYGIKKTICRQKWTHDSKTYVSELVLKSKNSQKMCK